MRGVGHTPTQFYRRQRVFFGNGRRLTFMMPDVAAAGPTSVRHALHDAGLLNPWNGKASKRGTRFAQPLRRTSTGMADVSHINICGRSTGKAARRHKPVQHERSRPGTPLSADGARRLAAGYVEQYNELRLHDAGGFVTPRAKLGGREAAICAARDRKPGAAQEQRKQRRQAARKEAEQQIPCVLQPLMAR